MTRNGSDRTAPGFV
ncbi:hypothetical protein FG05_35332 [Fusarium graminearum]|nr:hypothetical protein FG05_35332 [Fusarium graminearum]